MSNKFTFNAIEGQFDLVTDYPKGKATLVGGTVTVSTTSVDANSIIFLTGQNTSGTIGELYVTNIVAGTSFDIKSSSATDTRDIAWVIMENAPAPVGGGLWLSLGLSLMP